jgi:hypothetical protein
MGKVQLVYATDAGPRPGRQRPGAGMAVRVGRQGRQGHRHYDWAFIRLDNGDPAHSDQAAQRWLLVRRNQRTGELAFYRCWMPHPVPLATLVRVAGRRWTIEAALAGLKTTQLGPKQVLRSRSPELVAQEVWAHLLVHYALRAVMHTAAPEQALRHCCAMSAPIRQT